MPSTYSTSLKIQLIGTGEQAGTWGTTTNYNLGTLLEQAITGVVTLSMGDATYTMTNYNGLSDEARNAVLILNGPITAPQYLVAPAGQQKTYIVRNRTGNTVTLTTGTGSNISVANAASEVVFTDGANFYSATQFNYINGDLTVTGNVSVGKNITVVGDSSVAGNAVFLKNIYGNASTDQWYLPVGNTASRTSSPLEGLIRYNSEGEFYEGYANNTWVRFLVANQGSYTITYLVVSGGGGGGYIGGGGGGGGGGGAVQSTTGAIPGTTVLTMTIGAGGAAGGSGSTGTASTITGVATIGGGTGGAAGTIDGSGAGGTSGNGFGSAGGGGGGAAASGSGYNGGNGLNTLIQGTSAYFGGGGGGMSGDAFASYPGGLGGGGASGYGGASGTARTGGGGGGGSGSIGGNGGSGVIFLSMPTIYYTGTTTGSPTITVSGSNTILQYNGSGTYVA